MQKAISSKALRRIGLATLIVAALVAIYLTFGWVAVIASIYIVTAMVMGYVFAVRIFAASVVVAAPAAILFGCEREYLNRAFSWRSYLRIAVITIASPILAPLALTYFGIQELKDGK